MQLASRSTWWRLPIPPGPQKVERVLLDPERRYYLDGDMSDNQWYAKADAIVREAVVRAQGLVAEARKKAELIKNEP